jgi:putative hydrolase of the HAD superfamily
MQFPIRAIVVDWAGVMSTEAYWLWADKNIKDQTVIKGVDDRVDIGEMLHEEFLEIVSRESGKTPEEVWEGVKAELVINTSLVSLLRSLKKDYKIALLSNYTAPWLREIIDTNKLWDLFDEYIISSEQKMIKPNPDIFEAMLGKLLLTGREVVFTDDRQKNVDAAIRFGWNAVLFTNTEQFANDLKNLGVKVP